MDVRAQAKSNLYLVNSRQDAQDVLQRCGAYFTRGIAHTPEAVSACSPSIAHQKVLTKAILGPQVKSRTVEGNASRCRSETLELGVARGLRDPIPRLVEGCVRIPVELGIHRVEEVVLVREAIIFQIVHVEAVELAKQDEPLVKGLLQQKEHADFPQVLDPITHASPRIDGLPAVPPEVSRLRIYQQTKEARVFGDLRFVQLPAQRDNAIPRVEHPGVILDLCPIKVSLPKYSSKVVDGRDELCTWLAQDGEHNGACPLSRAQILELSRAIEDHMGGDHVKLMTLSDGRWRDRVRPPACRASTSQPLTTRQDSPAVSLGPPMHHVEKCGTRSLMCFDVDERAHLAARRHFISGKRERL
eukprot:scaffold327029_cov61-Tisochrysis_lutea.AAC.1